MPALKIFRANLSSNVYWGGSTNIQTGSILSLPPNFGLLTGAILLVLFGSRLRRWKWTLTGSVVITVLFGALLGLGTPERKGMMIAFVFINQVTMGWGQFLSIAYTQLGVSSVFFFSLARSIEKILTYYRLIKKISEYQVVLQVSPATVGAW